MNRTRFALASLLALAALPALGQLPASNPFAAPSTLPFQAPPFDRIKVTDYQPAIEEGMKIQRAEMDAIANDPAPPTFANTIEAMEKTGALLTRTYKVFYNIEQSDTNEAIQKIKSEVAPKLAAHNDAINLNPKLYARIKAIYAQRATLGLDPEAKYLVERYNLTFVRAGADLSDADKTKLMALNEEESRLTTAFGEKLRADSNASAPVVSDEEAARRRDRRRARRGGRSREGAQARRQVGPRAPEHDAAAGALVADGPRPAPACPRGLGEARQPRRRERHDGDHRAPGRAARAEGEAPRLQDLRRLRPRRPDGEDAAERRQADDRPRPGLDRQGARRGGADPEADRRGEGRLRAFRRGLGALLREGPQGRVRPRRVGGAPVPRARPGPERRRLLRGEQDVRHHLQAPPRHPGLQPRRARLGGASTPTARRSRSTTATTTSARPRAAARGATPSWTRAASWGRSPSSRTT